MKRLFARAMALVLVCLLAVGGMAAMAEKEMGLDELLKDLDGYTNWDVVTKKATVYSDKACKNAIGSIPALTVVRVETFPGGKLYDEKGVSVTRVISGGKAAYIRTDRLLKDRYPQKKMVVLKKGTRVYQRPDASSASCRTKRNTYIWVCAVKNGWALVRTEDYDFVGCYAFVRVR